MAVGRMGFRPSNAEWREMISVAVEAAMAEKDGGDLAEQACSLISLPRFKGIKTPKFGLTACTVRL